MTTTILINVKFINSLIFLPEGKTNYFYFIMTNIYHCLIIFKFLSIFLKIIAQSILNHLLNIIFTKTKPPIRLYTLLLRLLSQNSAFYHPNRMSIDHSQYNN